MIGTQSLLQDFYALQQRQSCGFALGHVNPGQIVQHRRGVRMGGAHVCRRWSAYISNALAGSPSGVVTPQAMPAVPE